jgi:small subunit ribosomal protein S4
MSKRLHSKNKPLKSYKIDIWGRYILNSNSSIDLSISNIRNIQQISAKVKNNYLYTSMRLPSEIVEDLKKNKINLIKLPSTWNILYLYNYSAYLKKNKQYLLQINEFDKKIHRKSKTNYGILLTNRQKLRKFYGNISLKQFKKILKKGKILNPNSKLNTFLYILETRLDIMLYRLNLVNSIYQARQLISHKHILINGETINLAKHNIKFLDILTIDPKEKFNILNRVEIILKKKKFLPIPNYIEANYNTLEFIFLKKLDSSEVFYPSFYQKDLKYILMQILNFI